jgi:hypothetical protein
MSNLTTPERRPGWPRPWLVALLLAVLIAGGMSGAPAQADAGSAPKPPGGIATGAHRAGVTKAGLVSLSALGESRLWLASKDPRATDARFDVQVELLNDGAPVATGLRQCVTGSQAGSARQLAVPWGAITSPQVNTGDVLALRVSARVGTTADAQPCGAAKASGLRLFYDGKNRASQFAATLSPDPSATLYLAAGRDSCGTSGPARGPALTEHAPRSGAAMCADSGAVRFGGGNAWKSLGTWSLPPQCDCDERLLHDVRDNPPAPKPEPVTVTELPLPPVTASTAPGSCTTEINPRRTGCIGQATGLESGSFLPDGRHILAIVRFAGAPAAPDPASNYTGDQLILIKADGTTFPNGDPWKCVTCGVPARNAVGRTAALDHPETFPDGRRVRAGSNVIDCAPHRLSDAACTPDKVHIFPIRWNVTADGSGAGGSMREIRLHPDGVHLGFNSVSRTAAGKYGQHAFLGRLIFNSAPTTGAPLAPRYDLANVTMLFDPAPDKQPVSVDPDNPGQLKVNLDAKPVGELRGFSGSGREVTYVGYPVESSNIDVFAADLTTGKVRRLTAHPEYTDPIAVSPDDEWTVAMDTRGTDRQMFMAGMRAIPPITDLVTTSATSSTRNNGQRRFFQPFLIDRHGDRGSYQGQQLNAAGDGGPGAINDPYWNGRADPQWSPDGTQVVFWQDHAEPPACGGANPLPCQPSTAPGGRTARIMLADLTARKPLTPQRAAPISDTVPWGTPYVAGSPAPERAYPPQGDYTLPGKISGTAKIKIAENAARTTISTVAVTYTNYSDDGYHVLNGTESTTTTNPSPTLNKVDWHSDLVQTGCVTATKKTSSDGFHLTIDILTNIFEATGTLTTTIDGRTYTQPANGT